jgi:hypothetical protein
MKKVISLFIAICFCICAAAQKPVVVVDHFTSASCKASDLINLRNHVITGIHETGNVNLIDVEAEATLAMEAERRSSELSLSDQTARLGAMKTLGANYVITGTAAKLGADRKRSDYYTGNVVFTLKVVNTEDGTIVGAETYQYSDISAGSASSADGALYETLKYAKNAMPAFVSKYFRLQGSILELDEMKNGKLKTCYVNLGSSYGLNEGDELIVHEVKKIAGIEGREEVGKLKVEAIVADGLSRCRITAGADDILTAFQAGHELCVEGKEKKAKKTGNAAEAGRDVMEAGRKAVDFGEKAVRVGEGISRIVKMLR